MKNVVVLGGDFLQAYSPPAFHLVRYGGGTGLQQIGLHREVSSLRAGSDGIGLRASEAAHHRINVRIRRPEIPLFH